MFNIFADGHKQSNIYKNRWNRVFASLIYLNLLASDSRGQQIPHLEGNLHLFLHLQILQKLASNEGKTGINERKDGVFNTY